MRISDWSSDVCSSDLQYPGQRGRLHPAVLVDRQTIPESAGRLRLVFALPDVGVAGGVGPLIKGPLFLQLRREPGVVVVVRPHHDGVSGRAGRRRAIVAI